MQGRIERKQQCIYKKNRAEAAALHPQYILQWKEMVQRAKNTDPKDNAYSRA